MNSIYKSRGIVGGRFGVAEVSRNVRATERAALRKSRRGQETDKRRNIGSPLTVSSSPERKLTLVEKLALYKKEKAKKAGNAKHKKKIFKVAHIVYDDKQWFSSGQPGKIKPKAQVRNHERTRFSARLASKQKELQKKNAVAKKSTIPDSKPSANSVHSTVTTRQPTQGFDFTVASFIGFDELLNASSPCFGRRICNRRVSTPMKRSNTPPSFDEVSVIIPAETPVHNKPSLVNAGIDNQSSPIKIIAFEKESSPVEIIGDLRSASPVETFDTNIVNMECLGEDEHRPVVTSKKSGTPTHMDTAAPPHMDEAAAAAEVTMETNETVEEHDVPYFRKLMKNETDKLESICELWEEIKMKDDIPDEVVGNIRASIGKARLLIKERFSQFGGLIDDSEFHRGEKEVTCMDLQGFWDMIYMQVENVQDMFKDLEILQNNNWKEEEKIVVKPKPVKKVAKKAKPGLSEETKKRRAEAKEAAKKRLAEAKAKSAMLTKAKSSTPNTSVPEVVKTFEAGFFKIASPVKPPTRRVQAGTSAKTTMRLIKNVNASSPCSPVVELLRCNQMRKAKLSSTPNKQIHEKENEDFAKYLVPTMSEESSGNEPSIIDLNEQAEISMVTESTQQLEDLKIRSPRKSQKRTPVSRHFMDRNNTSNDSISTGFPGPCLGLNTPVQNGQMMNDNYLFTPMESTTNARASIDLIKFDSSDAVSDTSTFSPLEPQRQRRRSARIHSANPNPAIFSPL